MMAKHKLAEEKQKFSFGHVVLSFPLDIPIEILSRQLDMSLGFKEEVE